MSKRLVGLRYLVLQEDGQVQNASNISPLLGPRRYDVSNPQSQPVAEDFIRDQISKDLANGKKPFFAIDRTYRQVFVPTMQPDGKLTFVDRDSVPQVDVE